MEVTLGDGSSLKAPGRGMVMVKPRLQNGKTYQCNLNDVLFVPSLVYNLISVAGVTKAGKLTEFTETECRILDGDKGVVATGCRMGSLYYLNIDSPGQQANLAHSQSRENIWHRRFGHLGVGSLRQLTRENLVDGFDFDPSLDLSFCEPCAEGKHCRVPFHPKTVRQSKQLLELVHSDVCGRIDTRSLSGAEYFVTFLDDYTHNSIPRKLPIGIYTGYFTRYIEIVRKICNSTARVK